LQIQNNIVGCTTSESAIFRGPFDALQKIVSGYGIRGLYRGFACTTWREVPAFGLYFSAYDYVKDIVSNVLATNMAVGPSSSSSLSSYSSKNNLHSWAASSLAGGFSGALTWAIIYPFDVIKTRIQTSPLDTPMEQRRMISIYRHIMQEYGWKFLFRGLGVTLLRAFPVNAIIFPVYEFTLAHLAESGIGGATTLTAS
jgi:solute carrier family 25 carnitine/acylcarnitine transporter 20/29